MIHKTKTNYQKEHLKITKEPLVQQKNRYLIPLDSRIQSNNIIILLVTIQARFQLHKTKVSK